jgi:hypothetical protein
MTRGTAAPWGQWVKGGSFRGAPAPSQAVGVVFKLRPGTGKESVLYSFCSDSFFANCSDGYAPIGSVISDSSDNLYGIASDGNSSDTGKIFELTPNKARTQWTEKVLYTFCDRSKCTDGANPGAGLIMDKSGNLYGTARSGGAHGGGVVFELVE